ncbi:prolyl aminopeptidase [Teredinibacter waterburyi]|jgi:prolyl aminopeptidase (EC:3.4.11.5). Serine peptidase. MEROPS family S33|uniref:prolyl aminopeptidase n=1 Tax=Teredinibacter waterburyi TaxID=1500538 RepID=UPI00165F9B0D|nr:prolyl aminopeptidase [Teredinibacter waterburyi]
MQVLFPEIKPYARHHLDVGATHNLYVEECGSADGIPVLFVHGGPGSGCSKTDRRYFDPEKYRIILFDQRGAGRSTPHAELEGNTTAHLVSDIEVIRKHLDIERWLLFGGSWGSTLSLVYAQTHTERVLGLILRGIFLCRERDLQWFYQSGADRIFPDYWQEFIQPIPEAERHNMIAAYYARLTSNNEIMRMSAAKAWSIWEGRCATLRPNADVVSAFADPHVALSLARIEAHYFINDAFLDSDQIVRNMDKLEGIPGIIVHGRYDMVCPLDNATAIHKHWQDAELHIIRDAGHSSREPSIVDALVKATDEMANRLSGDGDASS